MHAHAAFEHGNDHFKLNMAVAERNGTLIGSIDPFIQEERAKSRTLHTLLRSTKVDAGARVGRAGHTLMMMAALDNRARAVQILLTPPASIESTAAATSIGASICGTLSGGRSLPGTMKL